MPIFEEADYQEPRSRKMSNATTRNKEDQEDSAFLSLGKLPPGKVLPSRYKSIAEGIKEDFPDPAVLFGEKRTLKEVMGCNWDGRFVSFGYGMNHHLSEASNGDLDGFPFWTNDEDHTVLRVIDEHDLSETLKRKGDLEEFYFRQCEEFEIMSHKWATAALSYLHKKGYNLKLVKSGLYETGEVALGSRIHFNFKAKRAEDPSAPVETYFGQLCHYGESMIVECCVSLGESDSLPYERDNRGCRYCTDLVHHPVKGECKGMITGLLKWSRKRRSIVYDMN